MGYTKKHEICIPFGFASSNPNDSTEYRFLSVADALDTTYYNRIYLGRSSTVTKVMFMTTSDTAYTDEAQDVILRDAQNSVDYALGTMTKQAAGVRYSYLLADLQHYLPATAGFQFKMTTPAYVTNPTGLKGYGVIQLLV